MKSIPFNDSKTVYDTLTHLQGGKETCNKKIPNYEKTFTNMPMKDMVKVLPILIDYSTSSDERNIKKYGTFKMCQIVTI